MKKWKKNRKKSMFIFSSCTLYTRTGCTTCGILALTNHLYYCQWEKNNIFIRHKKPRHFECSESTARYCTSYMLTSTVLFSYYFASFLQTFLFFIIHQKESRKKYKHYVHIRFVFQPKQPQCIPFLWCVVPVPSERRKIKRHIYMVKRQGTM